MNLVSWSAVVMILFDLEGGYLLIWFVVLVDSDVVWLTFWQRHFWSIGWLLLTYLLDCLLINNQHVI